MHVLIILLSLTALIAFIAWVVMEKPKEQIQTALNGVAANLKVNKPNHAESLKAWAQKELNDDPQLQTWLLSLPEEGLQALGEKIHEFGIEMGLDLRWLLEPEVETQAEARKTTEELVTDYCKLCMKAILQQQ